MGCVSAGSMHPGGVTAALADGAVRWISSGVDLNPYHALGSRADSDLIETEF